MQSTCGFSIAASDALGHRLLGDRERGVDAGDDPVERRQQVVGVVERAVEADVDLRAGEQAEAALALVPLADLLDPLPEPLGGDVVAEAVAGGVVGDRQVGVAALARRLGHLLERVAAVGEGRVGVQVAADVARARPAPAACPRAPPSARRGPRAAPARCRRSRAARRPPPRSRRASTSPRLGLGDPVLGDREAARHRVLAQLRRCAALEPVKCWSRLPKALGGDDPQVDRDRRCGSGPARRWARRCPAAAISGWAARCSASAAGSSAVAIRSMSLQVSAQRRAEPATSTRSAAGCSRSAAASSSAIGRTSESSSAAGALARLAEPLERGEDVLLGLRAEALELADPLAPRPPPCRSSSEATPSSS